jgi:hypothetical protein
MYKIVNDITTLQNKQDNMGSYTSKCGVMDKDKDKDKTNITDKYYRQSQCSDSTIHDLYEYMCIFRNNDSNLQKKFIKNHILLLIDKLRVNNAYVDTCFIKYVNFCEMQIKNKND